MRQTQLGKELENASQKAKDQFSTDIKKISRISPNVLRSVIVELAKRYPCINIYEMCAFEAQKHGIAQNTQDIFDAVTAAFYVWEKAESDPQEKVIADLTESQFISSAETPILRDLLNAAEPYRESAKVISSYLRLGSPLFVNIRGTVDIRGSFHKTQDEFFNGEYPNEVVDLQQVVMANLTTMDPDDNEKTFSFLMDETDLRILKRFVKNMEQELELTKGLIKKNG